MGELQVQSVGLSGGMPFIESDDPIPGLEVESVYIPGPRGLQYGGQFRGTWNMSSGVYAPAAPSASQAATYTPTTMTPDGTIPGVGIPYIAGVETSALTIGTNVMQASMPMPAYTPGDTVNLHYLVLCNSSATISDVRDVVAGNTPANPTYAAIAVEASGVLAYPFASLVIYNSGTITGGNAGAVVAGDVSYLRLDPTTNDITLQVGSTTVGPFTLDVGSFPPGDTIKLMVLTQSASSTVVFAASTVSFNLSDTTGGQSGFGTITNATLPVGALDNDWYEVSAGGYFHGKTTRAGQFVKLIRGKTDLIVVDDPTGLVRSVNGVEPVDGDVTLTPDDVSAASYNAQSLTAAQQIQAQRNIGTQLFFGQDFPTGTVAPAALMKFDSTGMWIDFVVRQVTPIWHGYVSSLMLMADTADKVVANTWADPYGYIHDGALRPDGTPQQGIACTPGNFASFDLSSGDFTIEFFFTPSAYDNTYSYHCGILSFGDGSLGSMRYFLRYIGGAGFQFYVYPSPGSPQLAAYSASVLTPGAEHHIAIQRKSGVYSITVNGADMTYEQHNVAPLSPVSIYEKLSLGQIFAGGYSEQMTGSIRQFRMTKGIAVYPTYPFTPPTSFPSSI